MVNVPSVIHTSDLKHSSGYVTSVILVHMEEGVLSVDHQVYQMRTTAQSARG